MGLLRFLLYVIVIYLIVRAVRAIMVTASAPHHRPRVTVPPVPERCPSPHEVLGVAPSASQSEVRAAYQKLVQQYHPDRVASMGPEIREVAERRTKEINAAYEALRRSSGARA